MEMRRRLVLTLPLTAVACGEAPSGEPKTPTETPDPIAITPSGKPERQFRYQTLTGQLVTDRTYRGRMTLVLLAATYDAGSQVQARYLETVVRRHAPRINALMLVMEPPQNAPLAEAFAASLGLSYDVALAGRATIAGEGPFPGLHHVPSLVLLDRQGREVWRHLGVIAAQPLDEAIAARDDRKRR